MTLLLIISILEQKKITFWSYAECTDTTLILDRSDYSDVNSPVIFDKYENSLQIINKKIKW